MTEFETVADARTWELLNEIDNLTSRVKELEGPLNDIMEAELSALRSQNAALAKALEEAARVTSHAHMRSVADAALAEREREARIEELEAHLNSYCLGADGCHVTEHHKMRDRLAALKATATREGKP